MGILPVLRGTPRMSAVLRPRSKSAASVVRSKECCALGCVDDYIDRAAYHTMGKMPMLRKSIQMTVQQQDEVLATPPTLGKARAPGFFGSRTGWRELKQHVLLEQVNG